MEERQHVESCRHRTRVASCFCWLFSLLVYCGRTAHRASGPRPTANLREVDVGVSRIYILVGKTGLGHEHGVVGQLRSGWLRPGAVENAGELIFDMKGFSADTDTARRYVGLEGSIDPGTRKQVNTNMLGPDVLDVSRYPTAACKIHSMKPAQQDPAAANQWDLAGELTLRGQTRPIRFLAKLEPEKTGLHVRGGFAILQTEYGITPFSKAFGEIGVADRLEIWGDLWCNTSPGGAK